MDVDSYLRNIVQEILRECATIGIQVHENFLNYYVKLLALDPQWDISTSTPLNRHKAQHFINSVVTTLKEFQSPSITTLKMQFYFECNMHQTTKLVAKYRENMLLSLKPALREITSLTGQYDSDLNSIYRQIGHYVTMAAGLGDPKWEPIMKEAVVALRSILNENELKIFLADSKFSKEDQVREFTHLVTGIRLFNRDCEKGGQDIEDLPKLLNSSLGALKEELQFTLMEIMDKVNLMTSAIDCFYVTENDQKGSYRLAGQTFYEGIFDDVEYTKDCLILYRQYEIYVRRIISQTEILEDQVNTLFNELQQALIDLHDTVAFRIATPVVLVFPIFTRLSEIWTKLQNKTILAAKLTQILTSLQLYVKQVGFLEHIPANVLGFEAKMTDAERLERTSDLRISQEGNKAQIFSADRYIDNVDVQYLGFCAWKLAETKGGLIPGNPSMGLAKAMNMNYVFSSLEAAQAFGVVPERYIFEVINIARLKPALINLLKIEDQLGVVQDIKTLVLIPPSEIPVAHAQIQCETDTRESNIDKTYMWNIWDLKRHAILLSKLAKCTTVSVQTEKSHGICAAKIQTCETRDQNLQTKKDNYTNVPKPSTYIFGVRGRKDDKQFVVDLTRPVHE